MSSSAKTSSKKSKRPSKPARRRTSSVNPSSRYAVIGSGSWGTAMAGLLAEKGLPVVMWGHDTESIGAMRKRRENKKFLPGYRLPDALELTDDPVEALAGADVVLSVIPTRWVRATWKPMAKHVAPRTVVVSLTKGVENRTLLRPTEILSDILPTARVAVLSGPSHAEEVVKGCPTTVSVAAKRIDLARRLQEEMSTETFRVYANRDLIGVELGGALKNVIAIAGGIIDGLGFGDNTKAALLTRGLREMARLAVALGAQRKTLNGLAGVGDLITTAVSPFGRNRSLGERLGRGETLDDVLSSTAMVFEGAGTTRSVRQLARKFDVEMPIADEVYRVLFRGKDPRRAVTELMTRRPKDE